MRHDTDDVSACTFSQHFGVGHIRRCVKTSFGQEVLKTPHRIFREVELGFQLCLGRIFYLCPFFRVYIITRGQNLECKFYIRSLFLLAGACGVASDNHIIGAYRQGFRTFGFRYFFVKQVHKVCHRFFLSEELS
nr:MAG TPA: hypothetical protein [Caudoviricetes sp.]